MKSDMKNPILLVGFILMTSTVIFSQGRSDLRISQDSMEGDIVCAQLQLKYKGESASLASQNYRIFYSSGTLKYMDNQSSMLLPDDYYTYNVVQHMTQVDASGIGDLAFEDNLGFINTAIILNNSRTGGLELREDDQWLPIIELCFEKVSDDGNMEIILARKELTAPYGRAFIELSQLGVSGEIIGLPIDVYSDMVLRE